MIKLILVSHGNLAKAFLESAEMIVGKQAKASYAIFCLGLGDSSEEFQGHLEREIAETQERDILLLSDLVSGTPFNVSGQLMQKYKLQHLSGVNFGLVLEALLLRETMDVKTLANHLVTIFPSSFLHVNTLIEEEAINE